MHMNFSCFAERCGGDNKDLEHWVPCWHRPAGEGPTVVRAHGRRGFHPKGAHENDRGGEFQPGCVKMQSNWNQRFLILSLANSVSKPFPPPPLPQLQQQQLSAIAYITSFYFLLSRSQWSLGTTRYSCNCRKNLKPRLFHKDEGLLLTCQLMSDQNELDDFKKDLEKNLLGIIFGR